MYPGEHRVALTPANVALLLKKGFGQVLVERQAGLNAQFLDETYTAAGAKIVSREELFSNADIMLKVRPPLLEHETNIVKEGSTTISLVYPVQNKATVDALAAKKTNVFAVRYQEWLQHGLSYLHLHRWI